MVIPRKQSYTEVDYYNLPENVRAELVDGQIYYQAAPSRIHQKILNWMNNSIYNYIKSKNGSCEVYPAPFAVKLGENKKTIVEPDLSVICDLSKLTDRGCTGAPDWIIEVVSPGNSSHDYVRKLNLYMAAGVREYWIINPIEQNIFVYHFEEANFKVKVYTFQDKVKVNIYDDFWIDFKEIEGE